MTTITTTALNVKRLEDTDLNPPGLNTHKQVLQVLLL